MLAANFFYFEFKLQSVGKKKNRKIPSILFLEYTYIKSILNWEFSFQSVGEKKKKTERYHQNSFWNIHGSKYRGTGTRLPLTTVLQNGAFS